MSNKIFVHKNKRETKTRIGIKLDWMPRDLFDQVLSRVRDIPGREYLTAEKTWVVPLDHYQIVKDTFRELDLNLIDEVKTTGVVEQAVQQVETASFYKDLVPEIDFYSLGIKEVDSITGEPFIPFAFQKEGAVWMSLIIRGLLGDPMGSGKTIMAIMAYAVIKKLEDRPLDRQLKMLVVCQANKIRDWCNEIEGKSEFSAIRIEGTPQKRMGLYGSADFTVVSYETFVRDANRVNVEWDIVAIDEVSKCLKSTKSLRSKALHSIDSKYRYPMSGTPIENNLMELRNILDWCRPGILGNVHQFRNKYMITNIDGKPVEGEHYKALKKAFAPYVLRRDKQVILPFLLGKRKNSYWVELSKEEKAEYNKLREGVLQWLYEQGDHINGMVARNSVMKLRQYTTNPGILGSEVSGSKMAVLKELYNDLVAEGHKVLMFTYFREGSRLIGKELGIPSLVGGDKNIDEIKRQFQNGEWNGLVSTDTLAYGHTLTAADVVIHIDPLYNPKTMEQREERADRIGQTRVVNVISLLAEKTVDERIVEIFHGKNKLHNIMFDEEDVPHNYFGNRKFVLDLIGDAL